MYVHVAENIFRALSPSYVMDSGACERGSMNCTLHGVGHTA